MKELFELAFSPINLVYTILLLVIILYWITVFIGIFSLDSFDVDVDTDIDVDVDVDVDVDADIDADVDADADVSGNTGGGGWFLYTLAFFNIGKVPFMLFMSFLTLFIWTAGLLVNHYIGHNSPLFGALIFVPNILVGLFVTKLITTPLKAVFKDHQNEFESSGDIMGKICALTTSVDDKSVGQARIPSETGAPLIIRVRANEGHQMAKGDKGLIIDYEETKKLYTIEPFFD